ncbi:MAG: hypothetical protein SVR08_16985 [Spirochaetota bacterium]|nr:hypothetical protein [Spirochaetota bacterium]
MQFTTSGRGAYGEIETEVSQWANFVQWVKESEKQNDFKGNGDKF